MLRKIYFSTIVGIMAGLVAAGCSSNVEDPIRVPQSKELIEKGAYLTKGLAACGFCHGETRKPHSILSGGLTQYDIYGEVLASNLTPASTGLGLWNPQQILKALRRSVDKDGEELSHEVHRGYEWMSDSDTLAIITYLKSVPPIEHEVEKRSIGFIARNTTGFWEGDTAVTGYIPDIERRYVTSYGRYLTDHVARCSSCHDSSGSIFSGVGYLAGGQIIKNERGEKEAPSLSSNDPRGLGSWSEEDLVHYLQTGMTPDNRRSDPSFCPTGFYRNGTQEDLSILAKFIKSVQ